MRTHVKYLELTKINSKAFKKYFALEKQENIQKKI
jgi:hypothetical protein